METGFHFKNMAPPEEVLPNGICESKCLAEDLCGWFERCTGESIAFDFPRRMDTNSHCILVPKPHPRCLRTSCTSSEQCQQQWTNQFGMAKGSHSIAQWQCPDGNTVFLGSICVESRLLGFGKVVLPTPSEPIHTSLIKSAVHGTLREMELAIENSILKWKLKANNKPIPEGNRAKGKKEGHEHSAVSHAIDYIREHYRNHALSLATVADSVGISSCYLSSLFREATGSTFHDYVKNLRLTTAKELMKSTNLTPTEVAWRSGFSTPRNLRRALKQSEERK